MVRAHVYDILSSPARRSPDKRSWGEEGGADALRAGGATEALSDGSALWEMETL